MAAANHSPPDRRRLLVWSAVLTAAALGLVYLTGGFGGGAEALSEQSGLEADLGAAPVLGALAPDFSLINTRGQPIRLHDLRGQYVLINFWATWCGPCRIEMPALQSRHQRFGNMGLVVLGVNFDEAEGAVRAYGEELGLSFPLLLDPGARIQQLYRVRGYPTSFFVDWEGIIRIHHIGVMTEAQLDGYLTQLGFDG
ncbi:MAG: redoxin domain-containing protein [Anaerolineales bacterium]|jgi:peroxiredoxin